jgi:ParB family transcriptional regulator, chromosome partitioning protein
LLGFGSALAAGADAVTQTRGDSMSDQAALRSIPIVAIRPSPYQYRTRFDDEKQRQLVESLRSTGLSTPILVRPLAEAGAFELVSGERRWRAAKELGWESIQCVCEEMTDAESAARAVTENEVRSDANIMEKAAGYKRLTEPPCNFNFEEIARRYGWGSSASVKRLVDLLDQPEPIQGLLSCDKIGEGHVRFLNRIKDLTARVKLAKRAADEGWSVKMTEERVAKVLAKAHGPREKSKRKTGATYEYDYNGFHCALFGAEVEISGRRFKKDEELVDQYLADYRSALQCFLRDIAEGSTAQPAPESSGEPASSIHPSPAEIPIPPASSEIAAEMLKEVEAAGQSLRDLFSQLVNKPAPTRAETTGDDATPPKP